MKTRKISILLIVTLLAGIFASVPTALAQSEAVYLDPSSYTATNPGEQFDVDIVLADILAPGVEFAEFSVSWDTALVEFVDAEGHADFAGDIFAYAQLNQAAGTLGSITNNRLSDGKSGTFGIITMTFRAVGYGTGDINVAIKNLLYPDLTDVPATVTGGCTFDMAFGTGRISFNLLASLDDGATDPYSAAKLEPPRLSAVGDTFWVKVRLEDVVNMQFGEVVLKFDPTKVAYVAGTAGPCPPFGGAVFVESTSQLSLGIIGLSNNRLSGGFTGDADYVKLQFELLDRGLNEIEFWSAAARDPSNADLLLDFANELEIELPFVGTAFPPTACFGPAGGFYDTGDVITLDSSCSTDGQDIIPSVHICPIVLTLWSVDYGDDGLFEVIDASAPPVIDTSVEQDIRVRLEVVAPDPIPPTSGSYVSSDVTEKVYKVRAPALGPAIDVYTNKGGLFDDDGCAFAPQELVTICAKVTWNGAPQQGKDVRFELRDPTAAVWASRIARTDADGVACVEVRLPWVADGDPDSYLGEWTIEATVDLAGNQVSEIMTFTFDYLVDVTELAPDVYDITVDPDPVDRGANMDVRLSVTSVACEDISGYVAVTVYDDVNQVIAIDHTMKNFLGSDSGGAYPDNMVFGSITIPSWAFVGNSVGGAPRVFINIYDSTGLPLAPERSLGFDITYTP